jgi:hypothetical protein
MAKGSDLGAVSVSCGAAHVACIAVAKEEVELVQHGGEATQRHLLTWGENQSGQLGYETPGNDARGAMPALVAFKSSNPVQV